MKLRMVGSCPLIINVTQLSPHFNYCVHVALDKARGKLGTELNSNVLSRQEPLRATVSSCSVQCMCMRECTIKLNFYP